jgi:uncharacterized SAM-binding protein YcdF (DUF218 family)
LNNETLWLIGQILRKQLKHMMRLWRGIPWSLRAMLVNSISVMMSVYVLVLAWLLWQTRGLQPLQQADAVMVLGARAYVGGQVNPCLAARVALGVRLHQSGYAPYLLVTGGIDREDGVSEADVMRQLAQQAGVAHAAILTERASTSTYENLMLSQPVLEQYHLSRVIIVSEPYHIARIRLLAHAQGWHQIQVVGSTESLCWSHPRYAMRAVMREPLAIIQNKLKGYY